MIKSNNPQKTVIVAGCTRSGLTLMMQILYKGGFPCYGTWPAFEDYYLENIDWKEAQGKAVKLVDSHKQFPPEGQYLVIRMRRDLEEQAKSIIKFINHLGIPINNTNIPEIKASLERDYKTIDKWVLEQNKHVYVDFEDLIEQPRPIMHRLETELGIKLKDKATKCIAERDTKCLPYLLEGAINDSEEKMETIGMQRHTMGRCTVLVSFDDGRWHMSISTPDASPSYNEIKEARYKYIPDNVTMAQLFPPKAEFVNFNPYCHHLYQV